MILNDYLLKYPPSHTYGEIIKKIRKNRVAYCYVGERVGSIIVAHDSEYKMFSPNGNVGNFADKNHNHELWAFIDEIEDSDFRQSAVNNLFYVYCNFYQRLLDYGIDLFQNI